MSDKPKELFRKEFNKDALNFSSSINTDFKLYSEDIKGSIAHAKMLARQKIITKTEAAKIIKALNDIHEEILSGKVTLKELSGDGERFSADDIHMAIEKKLIDKTGDVGGKLHTARSRNDQIALDERLYLRTKVNNLTELLAALQKTFVDTAMINSGTVISGYTHLQRAQPILLSHHLLAYVSFFQRDKERLLDCLKRVNLSPLGAGALAGTTFPIDRNYTANILGFKGIVSNSLDAVSDRDVQIEFISACSIIMMHLSRFCEELILWSSQEWDFAEIGDDFTTGSSMMPQKRNPDIAELIRGKTGRVYGNLISLLTVMKGLPLAYNRDMQEDKESIFDSFETVSACLHICSEMLKTIIFNSKAFYNDNTSDLFLATDIADYLTRKNVPFRKAHTITGSLVRYCLSENKFFRDLTIEEFNTFSTVFKKDVYGLLSQKVSLNSKMSEGSTSPAEVNKAIRFWKKKLK